MFKELFKRDPSKELKGLVSGLTAMLDKLQFIIVEHNKSIDKKEAEIKALDSEARQAQLLRQKLEGLFS